MTATLPAPPAWAPEHSSGDAKVDDYRKKALAALAATHKLAESGLKGPKLAALQVDALDYVDACLKYEDLWQRAQRPGEYPLRAAKLAKWKEETRKLVGQRDFWGVVCSWWNDYLP